MEGDRHSIKRGATHFHQSYHNDVRSAVGYERCEAKLTQIVYFDELWNKIFH